MNRNKKSIKLICAGGIAAALMFATTLTEASDAQVRAEAVIGGSNELAKDPTTREDSVIIPDLYDEVDNLAYGNWVPPAAGRDFRAIGFRPLGGLIVQDGTWFREFRADGSERSSGGFPFDCTNLVFQSPKGQGTQDTYLTDCQAAVILLDGTMRIYGNVKGQGLKGIAYDLESPNGVAYRVTAEPPPQITDAIADQSANAIEFRDGPRILLAGDRKSIFAIDITADITARQSNISPRSRSLIPSLRLRRSLRSTAARSIPLPWPGSTSSSRLKAVRFGASILSRERRSSCINTRLTRRLTARRHSASPCARILARQLSLR